MSFREKLEQKIPCLSLPAKALALAAAETIVAVALIFNTQAYEFTDKQTQKHLISLSTAIGSINAVELALLLNISWTVILLGLICLKAVFTYLHDYDRFSKLLAQGVFLLSSCPASLDPMRIAYITNELPPTAERHQTRFYFAFIVWSWSLSHGIYWTYAWFYFEKFIVKKASVIIGVLTLVYLIFVVVLELVWKERNRTFKNLKCPALEYIRSRGESMPVPSTFYLMAITFSGYFMASLVSDECRQEQLKPIAHEHSYYDVILFVAAIYPHLLSCVLIPSIELLIIPLVEKVGIKVTDLRCIGTAMAVGCVGIFFTALVQQSLDRMLKPAQKLEGIIHIFNMLPDRTDLYSEAFSNITWIELPPYSTTSFVAPNVARERSFDASVVNLGISKWEETHLTIGEEESIAYIVTKDDLIRIRSFSVEFDDVVGKAKFYIACSLKNCNGSLHFESGNHAEDVAFPSTGKFRIYHLDGGQYNISVTLHSKTVRVARNVTVRPEGLYTSIIYQGQGKVGFRTFTMSSSSGFGISVFFALVSIGAIEQSLFKVGLLHFMYTTTATLGKRRYLVYALFFLLYKGLARLAFRGFQKYIYNFIEAFVVNACLLYYTCCTLWFVYLARSYKPMVP